MTATLRATDTFKPAAPSFFAQNPIGNPTVIDAVFAVLYSTSIATPAPFRVFQDTAAKRGLLAANDTTFPHPALDRIAELASYEAGWNGPESVGPTRITVEDARRFATRLLSTGNIADPYISLADDGEINFYWKSDSLVMDLGFTGNGRYSFFAQASGGREFIEDGAAIDDALPAQLLEAMRA